MSKRHLYDGSFHDVDSSEMAFKIAGSLATRQLTEFGGAVLLEPTMKVEIVTPEANMGDVVGDLESSPRYYFRNGRQFGGQGN